MKKQRFSYAIAMILYLWANLAFGDFVPSTPTVQLGIGNVQAVVYAPDGKVLVVAESNNIWFYDAESLEVLDRIRSPAGLVRSIAFSPDAKVLVSGGADGVVRLWDVETKQETAQFFGHQNGVYTVTFSPDGKTIASAGISELEGLRLWSVETRELIASLPASAPIAFNNDGTYLISTDRLVHVGVNN